MIKSLGGQPTYINGATQTN